MNKARGILGICVCALLGSCCAHASGLPSVVMLSASQTSLTSGSANGAVNPNGFTTMVYVEYGLTTNYGSTSTPVTLPQYATALAFNGVNQNGLVSGFGNIAPTNEITIEFWEYANALGNNAPCFLDPEYSTNRIAVSLPWADGGTYWDFGDITSGGRLAYYPPAPLTDVWQHYALVASQSGNYMKIYRNGNLEAQTTGMEPFVPYSANLLLAGGTVNDYYFFGGLCEFRIWRAALDQTTLQTWMSSSLNSTHPYFSNLAGYWPMSDGSGSTASDQSSNRLDAVLQNGPLWIQGPSLTNYQVSVPMVNLAGNTVYHYRLFASNQFGIAFGSDMTFQTGPFAVLPTALPGVALGAAVWGDFNNDGKLDVLFAGAGASSNLSQIWLNAGGGNFSNLNLSLPGVLNAAVAVGDFDNDGLLDFVIAGAANVENDQSFAQVWRNLGNGSFVKIADLSGVDGAAVAVGDFDNDGHLDIVIAGMSFSNEPIAQIWRNQGNGTFSNSFSFPGVEFGSVTVADFDGDGYQDVLLTGSDAVGGKDTELWHNLGNGTFTNLNLPFPEVSPGAVGIGDLRNHGLLDILLTGRVSKVSYVSEIWQNQGDDQFSNLNVSLPGVSFSAVAVGDANNDGQPDFFVAGATPAGALVGQLYTNQGNGTFLNDIALGAGFENGSAAWGESQNDGRLDLLLTGFATPDEVQPVTQIIKNYCPVTNTPPTAPTGLVATPGLTSVVLGWNAATDAQTPSSGLSYNVRIGTHPGGFDVVSPEADVTTGRRRLPALGNAGERLFAIYNLPYGTYYWSVQAIDSAFAGSVFAAEGQFSFGSPLVTSGNASQVEFTSAVLNGTVIPNAATATAWFEWGTTTNYGNNTTTQQLGQGMNASILSQMISPLEPGTTYNFRLVVSNAYGATFGLNQTFTTPINPPPPVFTSVVRQPAGKLLLQMQGSSAISYTLLASTNLKQWQVVTNLTAALDGQLQYFDTITNSPRRFYRLQYP